MTERTSIFAEPRAPGNVITALAAVQAEIGGIGKTRPKDGQLNYAYRGIDAIASEAQPLFGKHGIVIVPTDTTVESVTELTVNSKPWTDTLVSVRWTIYGPGGLEDCVHSTTYGLGRDNSDKGVNKAATQAFKNLMLRVLCIGDPQDDADQPQHQNNYTDPRPLKDHADLLSEQIAGLSGDMLDKLRALGREQGKGFRPENLRGDDEWYELVNAIVNGEKP